jgi:nicotinate-nucleotide adenylyltransferase
MGGTFDPIHIAHLIVAEEAIERLGLSEVIFIPAARPPHKADGEVTAFEHRLEMVRLATLDNPRLSLSDTEARRPGKSYTIETIRELQRQLGGDERPRFIIGADSLAQFLTWKSPQSLLTECVLVVVPRPGVSFEDADPSIRERALLLDVPLIDVSSSDIRDRVRHGRTIRYLVPARVSAYIEEKNLYS